MKSQTRFEVERSGDEITSDKTGIVSNCQEIIFSNEGTWPVDLAIRNTTLVYRLDQYNSRAFGSDRFDIEEKSIFDITFIAGGSGTKSLMVEKANLIPLAGVEISPEGRPVKKQPKC